jgi:hypothetical protein
MLTDPPVRSPRAQALWSPIRLHTTAPGSVIYWEAGEDNEPQVALARVHFNRDSRNEPAMGLPAGHSCRTGTNDPTGQPRPHAGARGGAGAARWGL